MRKFEEFLANQAADGVVESQGAFTLAAEEALKKMSLFTLNSSEEWILKVVQSAVVAKAGKLEFKIRRDTIQIDIFCDCDWDLESLSTHVLDPSFCGEPHWQELFVGLRSILTSHSFLLTNRQGRWLAWNGRGFEEGDDNRALPGESRLKIMARKTSESFVDYAKDQVARAREVAAYQSVLERRACYAPLELSLDGRLISSRERLAFRESVYRESSDKKGSVALLWVQIPADHQVALGKAPWRPFKDRLISRTYFLSTPARGRDRSDSYFALRYNFVDQAVSEPGKSSLGWQRESLSGRFSTQFTRFGVCCAEKSLKSKLDGEFVLPADDESSDLTGLQIELSEELLNDARKKLSALRPLVVSLVRELRAHRSRMNVELPQWKDVGVIGGGVGGGFAVSVLMQGIAFATALKGGLIVGGLTLPFLFTRETMSKNDRNLLVRQVTDFLPEFE